AMAAQRRVWAVRELMSAVRTALEREYTDVWVEGEISNFRPAESGHLYFTLKDGDAQLRLVMFRTQARLLRFKPENGMQIVARGRITVYEARGEMQLAAEVTAGLKWFNRKAAGDDVRVDVIIIARGGGSVEDLAAFNHEGLARAIAASDVPVISAIGHETDFTIADFVADLRAPTPSAAAELVIESRHRMEEQVGSLAQRLARATRYRLLVGRQTLTEL